MTARKRQERNTLRRNIVMMDCLVGCRDDCSVEDVFGTYVQQSCCEQRFIGDKGKAAAGSKYKSFEFGLGCQDSTRKAPCSPAPVPAPFVDWS